MTVRTTAAATMAFAICLTSAACGGEVGASASAASQSARGSSPASPTQPTIGPFPSDLVGNLLTDVDIEYTEATDCGGTPCTVPGDVLAPESAADVPTVVLVGGGSTPFAERRYQADLAVQLAERGAVVFLMSYRSAVTGNYDSATFNDLRCAVRYARASTERYGGDPDRVVVVGHSQGGFTALGVAIEPEQEAEACLADGSGKPDGVVALGSPSPSLRDAGDTAPPMWLFAGSEDGDAEGNAERLREAGFDAEAQELPGVTHSEITDPVANPEIVDLIFDAVESI